MGDIIGNHAGKPAVVTLHGPSLNSHVEKIEQLQRNDKIIRFSVNNWYDSFSENPDYWILASSHPNDIISETHDKKNKFNVPVFIADTVDPTDSKFIEETLRCDYLLYDQKHFKGHTCMQILNNFMKFCNDKATINTDPATAFSYYGNNSTMFEPPRCYDNAGFSSPKIAEIGYTKADDGGPDKKVVEIQIGFCCSRVQDESTLQKDFLQAMHGRSEDVEWSPPKTDRLTIQETLQQLSGHDSHYSTGDTVAVHAIAFAIIMKCNPIYISGLDLDYSLGYSDGSPAPFSAPGKINDDWERLDKNMINDLQILVDSAKKMGIEVINLNPEAWYNKRVSINVSNNLDISLT
tara:strand:- start:25429 stop:26475 length:1047 start_codon:yes stop_codon:yes gene_type:complete